MIKKQKYTYDEIFQRNTGNNKASNKIVWLIYSKVYDLLMYFKPYKNLLEVTVDSLKIKKDDKLINYGCGTGNLEKILKRDGFQNVLSLDFSPSMLNVAKKKCPECEYVQIDLQKEKYNQAIKFDKAVSVNVIYNLDDLDHFFSGVRGNLKIGGIFVVSTSINDGFGTLIKDHFKNIGLRDFVVSIVLIPLFLFVLLINIYLD
ncbi:MAG: class I SAM-dependent methyltransferase, partial [Patescibacteria group bacterium]|nr:class I SAM-dependent methyltransferase [Patescibacteria group bacterium]